MPETNENIKIAQGKATVANLIKTAMQEFSTKGYAKTSTEEIVRLAGVTRGALYHHFSGKRALFIAVFEQAQQKIGQQIEQAAKTAPNLWESLVVGCRAFLQSSSDPQLQQIVVIDAPSVLDWASWRSVDARPGNGLALLKEVLDELTEAGQLKPLPIEALAHLLSGAMNEAALWIAQSKNPKEALEQAQSILEALLLSLRIAKNSN